ncbi:MAG: Hpt domain-containing protein, partial [Myxococcota bacterium]
MNTDFEGRIFEPKSRPAGASVETNLLRLSLGTLAVFAVLLGAFFWVERRLATSLGMNETVVVPARDVAGGIDEALGQLLVRQSRLAGASSSASLEALADRSQAEARLNEVRGHVGGVAESLRKAGASEIPHDFASTFDETFEGFLEADARFLSATQVQHRSAERLDAEIRSVENDLKVFLESANGLSGKMRFGYGSSLRRLRRELAAQGWTPRVREALREEVMDSSNRRSRVVGDVLGLASELNRLAGKVGLTSNRDQLRSLVANELVPTRDRLIVALEELRHEVHGDEELLPIVDRLDASTAGLSIRILSKDGESLVALKRSLLTAQLEGAEVQTRLAQLAGEATKLSEALLTAAESESRGFDDGLRSAGSTTRWLLLAVMIVAGLGGVLGFRSVRASVKSLRATNEDLVRLKDELTELNQGLEAKVAERTAALDAGNRAMRLVLDNVEQGLVTLDPKGRLQTQRSARFDEWFGAQAEGTGFGQVISGRDEKAGAFFHIAWDEVEEGIMPLDVNLSQLPHRVKVGGATLHLDYRCISKLSDDVPDQTLVMVSDITQQLERERAEAAEREFASVFRHLMKDRSSFLDFFTEAASIVGRIEDAAAQDPKELFRAIHTLKGNCAIYGLERMAQLCHEIETAMVDESRGPSENERRSVTGLWRELSHKVGSLIDDGGQQRINV